MPLLEFVLAISVIELAAVVMAQHGRTKLLLIQKKSSSAPSKRQHRQERIPQQVMNHHSILSGAPNYHHRERIPQQVVMNHFMLSGALPTIFEEEEEHKQ